MRNSLVQFPVLNMPRAHLCNLISTEILLKILFIFLDCCSRIFGTREFFVQKIPKNVHFSTISYVEKSVNGRGKVFFLFFIFTTQNRLLRGADFPIFYTNMCQCLSSVLGFPLIYKIVRMS